MKIGKIEKGNIPWTFIITFTPTLLEKIFGMKKIQKEYKDISPTHYVWDEGEYVEKCGEKVKHDSYVQEVLDNHVRAW